jgi:nucleoid DNA-binding protein
MAKAAAAKSMNKSALLNDIANMSGLTRKQVSSVFDSLTEILKQQVGKKGPGVLNVMRLVKVYKVQKPAQPAGKRPNPFKPGEMMEVKAKPARNVIKVRPLKDLKSMV